MEQRVSLITLGVDDLEKSSVFYQKLGWKVAACSYEQIIFFQLHAQVLALYPKELLLQAQNKSQVNPVPGGITLGINLPTRQDVDEEIAQFIRAGGTLLHEAEETPWGGYTGYVADIDNHPWEISWVPVFPLGERGGLWIE